MLIDGDSKTTPVLVALGYGDAEMLNYRVKGDMYIGHRLFDRAQLVLGTDIKAKKVESISGTTKKS